MLEGLRAFGTGRATKEGIALIPGAFEQNWHQTLSRWSRAFGTGRDNKESIALIRLEFEQNWHQTLSRWSRFLNVGFVPRPTPWMCALLLKWLGAWMSPMVEAL